MSPWPHKQHKLFTFSDLNSNELGMEGWDTHKRHMVIVSDRDLLASKNLSLGCACINQYLTLVGQ